MAFIGVDRLIRQTTLQADLFKDWIVAGKWHNFGPDEHFDWWAFPLDRDSNSHGDVFNVAPAFDELSQNQVFLTSVLENAEHLAFGWGWDLRAGERIANRAHRYGIRISKCGESLGLWGMPAAHEAFRVFTEHLHRNGFVSDRTLATVTGSKPTTLNPAGVDLYVSRPRSNDTNNSDM